MNNSLKICQKCSTEKSYAEFYKRVGSSDGLRHICKKCCNVSATARRTVDLDRVNAYHAKWRASNPEKGRSYEAKYRASNRDKVKAATAKWAAENPEKVQAKAAAYRAAHPERTRAASAAYRASNPEKIRAGIAAWRSSNPDSRRIHEQNRRARKLEAGGYLSKDLAAKLLKLQGGKCPCCAQSLGIDYQLDHKMPLALGGSNTDDNMQLLHRRCNLQKHAKHPIDFMQGRGFLL